jgi:iron-sulfur cluster insertion protein
VKVFIDPQSAKLLAGTEVDFQDSLESSGFSIKNPNAKSSCGCGHSFSA